MTPEEIRQTLEEILPDGGVFLEGHDDAIIGFIGGDTGPRVCYEADLIVQRIMERDGCSRDDANDWFDYNILGSVIEGGPVYLTRIDIDP